MARAKKNGNGSVAAGRSHSLVKPLARVGDPLILPDGRIIQPIPAGGVVEKPIDVKPQAYKPTTRRNVGDLPDTPGVLNAVACVLMYTILGVADREISDAMKITPAQVKELRKKPAYSECFGMVQDEFINVNSDLMAARIAAYGNESVTQMAKLAFRAKYESTQFKATQDLLDRGGFTKKEQSKGSMGDALRIVVTNGANKTEVSIGEGAFTPD